MEGVKISFNSYIMTYIIRFFQKNFRKILKQLIFHFENLVNMEKVCDEVLIVEYFDQLRHNRYLLFEITSFFQKKHKIASYPLYHSKYETFYSMDTLIDRGFHVSKYCATSFKIRYIFSFMERHRIAYRYNYNFMKWILIEYAWFNFFVAGSQGCGTNMGRSCKELGRFSCYTFRCYGLC